MEVVSNLTSAASRAIWGDATTENNENNTTAAAVPETKGTEPLNGELGDIKKGEPYDKGNLGTYNWLG